MSRLAGERKEILKFAGIVVVAGVILALLRGDSLLSGASAAILLCALIAVVGLLALLGRRH